VLRTSVRGIPFDKPKAPSTAEGLRVDTALNREAKASPTPMIFKGCRENNTTPRAKNDIKCARGKMNKRGRAMNLSKIIKKSVLKKIAIGVVIFFAVFTIVGFFVLPPILKSILAQKLSENLHREVTIEDINLNPYTLSVTVKKLMIKERDRSEPFVSFDELFVNLQTISLYEKGLVLKEIRLKEPYIAYSSVHLPAGAP
jgi:hypothetical protein